MTSAKTAKERLLKVTKADESFEAMAAERTGNEGKPKNDYYDSYRYWRGEYDAEVERKREWKAIAVRQEGEIDAFKGEVTSLKADLESMKEEKCRWQRESKSLTKKLETSKGQADRSGRRINTMKAERGLRRAEIARLKKELAASERSGEENAKLAQLFRAHLDDSADDMENDNEWEQIARQETWNEIDANASRRIHVMGEGIDE